MFVNAGSTAAENSTEIDPDGDDTGIAAMAVTAQKRLIARVVIEADIQPLLLLRARAGPGPVCRLY